MWVVPDEVELEPGYEQLELNPGEIEGTLAVLASCRPEHRDRAAIRIHNRYAALHVARLAPGQTVTVPDAPFAHVYLARGDVRLEEAGELSAGDAARLTAAGQRRVTATLPSELLVWEMHATLAPPR
jgi:redox-sensitive bicupin YhaK (pirin superfamily)